MHDAPPVARLTNLNSRRRQLPPVRVLEHLDEAVASIAPADRRPAVERCVAPALWISAGPWRVPASAGRDRGWLGLLVIQGLLTRTVEVDGLRAQELLGPGDVLRPWDDDGAARSVPSRAEWRAVEPAAIAVLDDAFARAAAPWPSISSSLIAAALRRSRATSILLALSRARRADDRLVHLFWHLADRWGRVGAQGVHIPLRITHSVLAELVCLRRPTVSTTLAELQSRGQVTRMDDGSWLMPHAAAQPVAA